MRCTGNTDFKIYYVKQKPQFGDITHLLPPLTKISNRISKSQYQKRMCMDPNILEPLTIGKLDIF